MQKQLGIAPVNATDAATKGYVDVALSTFVSSSSVVRDPRTTNTALAVADNSKWIDCTGTFAQTFIASATLTSGWWCRVSNNGVGLITLTPNGSELIDSLATRILSPGETRLIQSDGTTLRTVEASAVSAKIINTISAFTSSGTFVVPAGIVLIRPYAFGGGGAATGTTSGGGGGCSYGNITVVPGQSIGISISGGVAKVTANSVVTHTGNPASGSTAGTATKDASVYSGGAYSGGSGISNNSGGGAASGSPLGVGGSGLVNGGGGAWGRNATSSNGVGAGLGEVRGGSGGGGSLRNPTNYYTDPLLAPLTGAGGSSTNVTNYSGGDGGPGGGGGIGGSGGGRGGTGAGGAIGTGTSTPGAGGGFGGGAGWSSAYIGGDGGFGGGAGSGPTSGGAGGAACILIYY